MAHLIYPRHSPYYASHNIFISPSHFPYHPPHSSNLIYPGNSPFYAPHNIFISPSFLLKGMSDLIHTQSPSIIYPMTFSISSLHHIYPRTLLITCLQGSFYLITSSVSFTQTFSISSTPCPQILFTPGHSLFYASLSCLLHNISLISPYS